MTWSGHSTANEGLEAKEGISRGWGEMPVGREGKGQRSDGSNHWQLINVAIIRSRCERRESKCMYRLQLQSLNRSLGCGALRPLPHYSPFRLAVTAELQSRILRSPDSHPHSHPALFAPLPLQTTLDMTTDAIRRKWRLIIATQD